jgi:hypothetical protein
LIDNYVVAGLLTSMEFFLLIRPDKNDSRRMVFIFENTEAFQQAYKKYSRKEKNYLK